MTAGVRVSMGWLFDHTLGGEQTAGAECGPASPERRAAAPPPAGGKSRPSTRSRGALYLPIDARSGLPTS
jgi:hypothetical protein